MVMFDVDMSVSTSSTVELRRRQTAGGLYNHRTRTLPTPRFPYPSNISCFQPDHLVPVLVLTRTQTWRRRSIRDSPVRLFTVDHQWGVCSPPPPPRATGALNHPWSLSTVNGCMRGRQNPRLRAAWVLNSELFPSSHHFPFAAPAVVTRPPPSSTSAPRSASLHP